MAHFVTIEDDFDSYQVLKNRGIDLEVVNLRGWNPFSLIQRNSKKFTLEKADRMLDIDLGNLLKKNYNSLNCTLKELQEYESTFDYCIIALDNGHLEKKDGKYFKHKCTVEK